MVFHQCVFLLTCYRLFRGVFILELFYASQKSYRKPDTRARESCMSQMLALIEARLLMFYRILTLPPISHAHGSCARATTCLQQSHHAHHATLPASWSRHFSNMQRLTISLLKKHGFTSASTCYITTLTISLTREMK